MLINKYDRNEVMRFLSLWDWELVGLNSGLRAQPIIFLSSCTISENEQREWAGMGEHINSFPASGDF